MRRYFLIRTIECLFLFAFSLKVDAQIDVLKFRHLSIAEGLPQNTVNCFKQDAKGFIWVGTNGGLSRYDGYEFLDYTSAGSKTSNENLSSDYVNCLETTDDEKSLLIGTNRGLNIMDLNKGTFTLVPQTGSLEIDAVKKDNNKIWIGTSQGLMLYQSPLQPLKPVDLAHTFANRSAVDAIYIDENHCLWISFGKGKLVRYNPLIGKEIPLPKCLLQNKDFTKSQVISIKEDDRGNIWLGTINSGLFLLSNDFTKCENISVNTNDGKLRQERIRDIYVQHITEDVWIATRNGLIIIDSAHKHINRYVSDEYNAYSLSNNSICSIMSDYSGNMWIGTYLGGINVLEKGSNNFNCIERGSSGQLSSSVIYGVVEDTHDNLWIATGGSGLNYYNTKNGKVNYIDLSVFHTDANFVESLAEKDKTLWIGTLAGLFQYDEYSKQIKRFNALDKLPGITQLPAVFALEKSRKGGLWIGTQEGLFYKDSIGHLTSYYHIRGDKRSLPEDQITYLKEDNDGGVWIGRLNGLSYLEPSGKSFTNFDNITQVPIKSVFSIKEDSRGIIWIGTHENGLVYFDRKLHKFGTVDNEFGLPDASVRGIAEDKAGNLWVSCSNGIAKIIFKKKYPPFSVSDVKIVNYSVKNGLKSNEFLSPALLSKSGNMIFGGMNGLVLFNPDKMFINTYRPPVVITGFHIDNDGRNSSSAIPDKEAVTSLSKITLPYSQAYFTIKFSALNYINTESNRYAFKMEGLKGDKWHCVGTERSATYTNLEPGSYTFKVKAANNDGYWNNKYTCIQIEILPPLWRTWYAYFFYTLVVFGILFTFYFYSLRAGKLKNDLKVQQLINENEKEFSKQKIDFFTNISHEIKTPLTLILAPLEKLTEKIQHIYYPELSIMQRNGKRLMNLLDQLLNFRRFEAGAMVLQAEEADLISFLRDVLDSFEDFASKREIELQFFFEEDTILLWFDADKLEKIICNLLSNALKFTPIGGQVVLSVGVDDNIENSRLPGVKICVKDNGIGIAQGHLDKIFDDFYHYDGSGMNIDGTGIGLSYTKALVSLHHGNIEVESVQSWGEENGYTCFTIFLPLGDEHLSAREKATDKTGFLQEAHLSFSSDLLPDTFLSPEETIDEQADDVPGLLILEDNDELRMFIASYFRKDYKIYTASNGKEGMEIARETMPDIVISDIMMPETDGTTFCRLLKSDIRTSHIPVILLTALSANDHKIEGYESGADGYVTKPFSLNVLKARVINLLNSRKALQEYFKGRLVNNVVEEVSGLSRLDEGLLKKIMEFIEENLLEPTLNVEELSKQVNMSRVTLYRKIKSLTGMTVIELLRHLRLKKAASLLLERRYNINEVCYMCGFSDVDYFRKCFKKQYGSTPKEYEESHLSKIP